MKFVNLCPHQIDVVVGEEVRSYAPSGVVARCSQSNVVVEVIDGIPVTRQTFGAVEGLPPAEDGVRYIVSRLVASAEPERRDLLIPGPLVRGEDGQPRGCQGLSVL